jgi:hypothetical protein
MLNKAYYLLLQVSLFLVSPVISLIFALRNYKTAISQLFFVLFAFYFGYHCHFFHDESANFYEFQDYYVGYSFSDIISNPIVFAHGHDYYHVILKYLISRVSASKNFFGGVVCASHVAFFIFFFRQLKQFYEKTISYTAVLALLVVSLVFEFHWYSTIRFNAAVFFFCGFYLKYLNTKNPIYLIISFLSPLLHYSFVMLDLAVGLDLLLKYVFRFNFFRYLLLAASLVVRSWNVDFVPLLLKYVPWVNENLSYAVVNQTTRRNVLRLQQEFRENGNIVYNMRSYVMLFLGLFMLFVFKRVKIPKDAQYDSLFYMFLTVFTLANFGYGDLYFYERMLKVSLLFLWTYIFIMSVKNYHLIKYKNLFLSFVLLFPVIYLFITPLMQFRKAVFQPELIFGNFFMDWDGNDLNLEYGLKRR